VARSGSRRCGVIGSRFLGGLHPLTLCCGRNVLSATIATPDGTVSVWTTHILRAQQRLDEGQNAGSSVGVVADGSNLPAICAETNVPQSKRRGRIVTSARNAPWWPASRDFVASTEEATLASGTPQSGG
jgi:hypothetical protein